MDFRNLVRDFGEIGEGGAGVETMQGRIGLVTFEIDPQGGTSGARPGKAKHDPGIVLKQDPDALMPADRAIDRIRVGEIIGDYNSVAVTLSTRQIRQNRPKTRDQLICSVGIDFFVVMTRISVMMFYVSDGTNDVVDPMHGTHAARCR